MDKEIKAKWIAALRSGEYIQGISSFEREGKFCCLGVLCKVAGEPTHSFTFNPQADIGNWDFADSVCGHSVASFLARKNDYGWTFSKIADYIEKNL